MNIESWCQVEGSSNQQWTRATRRHYEHALKSSVFEENTARPSEGRMAWAKETKPDKLELHELAKRRHFNKNVSRKTNSISEYSRVDAPIMSQPVLWVIHTNK